MIQIHAYANFQSLFLYMLQITKAGNETEFETEFLKIEQMN